MAFIIKIENPDFARIIKGLESMCSVLTFDFSERGLGLNVSDDNNSTAISMLLKNNYFTEYEFTGSGVERVSLNAQKFSKILGKMSYPFQMESTMDGSIRLVDDGGRQTYKQNLIDAPEKYHAKSVNIETELDKLVNDSSAIVVEVMHQDIREALRNVGIDSKNVTISLDSERFNFVADSLEVEAEMVVPLLEAVSGKWELTYNISYFKKLLEVASTNVKMTMRLYPGRKSFVLDFDLENDEGYCRFTLAPVLQRKTPVETEEEVLEESVDEDESESELD
jgi:hypothetical protein